MHLLYEMIQLQLNCLFARGCNHSLCKHTNWSCRLRLWNDLKNKVHKEKVYSVSICVLSL